MEGGIIERYGSGIQRIKKECLSHGVIEPKFEEFQHGFMVTLYKEKRVGGINKVYEFIRQNPSAKAHDIAKTMLLTQRTTERLLQQLKDEGKIEFHGSKKTGGYCIISTIDKKVDKE